MNTYKIIFTRENGTQGTDHFAAINERQARKDFGECYRHSTATIISIELASTNAPATKQQERVAELEDKLSEAVKDYEAAHAAAHAVAEEKDAEIAKLKDQLKQIQETARWNGQKCDEEATAAGEAQRRAEAAEAEVIQLKAKLYDLLVAGR